MKKYNELLDLAIELEGLLLLKITRGESAPDEADKLIRIKAEQLWKGLSADEAPLSQPLESFEDEIIIIETPVEPESEPESERQYQPQPEPQPVSIADSLATDEMSVNQMATATADVSHVFTLNDKFRFCRELFRNSNEEFTDTINVLNAMESLEEAEDYLYNDLAWDPESLDVKAFIELIAPCYSMS